MDLKNFNVRYKEYPEEATGWKEGVYYPRRSLIREMTSGDERCLVNTGDYLKITSKMWTETEVTGFGIYPYVNAPVFISKTGLKDGEWKVVFANPEKESIKVNCYADEVLMVKDEEILPGCDKEVSFKVCSIHEDTSLQFFVSDQSVSKEDATEKTLYVKNISYMELPSKKPGSKPRILIASDSTVQTYEAFYYPQMGWGQVFADYVCPGEALKDYAAEDMAYPQCHVYERESIYVENRAIGARSARSFIDEGKWDALLKRANPGDYVLIQWAHNDATAVRPNRYITPEEFDPFLMKYADSLRSRGIYVIFVTPVTRRNCDDNNGEFKMSFKEYRDVMLSVGEREHIPTVDLNRLSCEYLNSVGPEEAKSLYLWCPAGAYPEGAYSEGVSDNTHLQEYGAKIYARMIAKSLLEMEGYPEIDALKPFLNVDSVPEKKIIKFTEAPVRKDVPTGFALQELIIENKVANFLLIWNDVEGAVSYNVYRKGSVDFQFFPIRSVSAEEKKNAAVLPFKLPAADVYQVKVTAVFADGKESDPSRIIEFRA